MNRGIDQLTKSLLGKDTLSECNVMELQRITAQYPFFGPGHFLLAQKLKGEDKVQYEKNFQKTSLYFQNSLWLEYISGVHTVSEFVHLSLSGKPVSEIAEQEIKTLPQEQAPEQNTITQPQPQEEENVEKSFNELVGEPGTGLSESTEAIPESLEGITQEQEDTNKPDLIFAHPIPESDQTLPEQDEQISEPIEEAQEIAEHIPGKPLQEKVEEHDAEIPPLKFETIDPASANITFQPYHTVDYFASQGIRFREEDKPADKFGQQLKSFTEWLKTMRKLPDSEVVVPPVTVAHDPKVTQLAEHSVSDGNVVTETMAEVWERQGDNEKAIETYYKLSLLNPAKSSYFAAKIEHLKKL